MFWQNCQWKLSGNTRNELKTGSSNNKVWNVGYKGVISTSWNCSWWVFKFWIPVIDHCASMRKMSTTYS